MHEGWQKTMGLMETGEFVDDGSMFVEERSVVSGQERSK